MKQKAQQRLIAFTYNNTELVNIEKEIKDGWNIVSLTSNNNHYIGIVEKAGVKNDGSVFIPPRKKIRIT